MKRKANINMDLIFSIFMLSLILLIYSVSFETNVCLNRKNENIYKANKILKDIEADERRLIKSTANINDLLNSKTKSETRIEDIFTIKIHREEDMDIYHKKSRFGCIKSTVEMRWDNEILEKTFYQIIDRKSFYQRYYFKDSGV